MLKPVSISLKNFKSFRELKKFEFPTEASLVFLTGTNEVDPELSSNGVGKSTLFDSLHWAFYGTSARGLKAGNTCTWGETGDTRVSCVLETHDGEHEISRTWRPNSLTVDGQGVSQEELEKLVGLNSLEFKSSVLMGQFNSFFLDLKPSDKLNLFTSVMDLEVWNEASSRSSSLSRDIERSDIPDLRVRISNLKGVVEYQGKQISQLEIQSSNFEKKKFSDLRKLEKELAAKSELLESSEREFEEARQEAAAAEDELANAEENRDFLMASRPVPHEWVRDLELAEVRVRGLIEAKSETLAHRDSGICSLCGQKLPENGGHLDYGLLEEELEELREELDRIGSRILKAQGDLEKEMKLFEESLNICNDIILEGKRGKSVISSRVGKCSDKYHGTRNEVNSLKNRIHDLANSRNRALEDIKRIKAERDANSKELEALEADLLEVESLYEATRFWVRGFRDVRLFLIEEALSALEMESNQALLELGLTDWRISFDVEKETKSGSISRGFTVAIDSPFSEGLVPWEAWSGGEGQRLRLATNIGLSNLIQDNKGVHSFLEVWDEPSQHLSEKGIDDLLEVLFSRAINTGKSVWVVDHSSLNYGGFDKTYRIIKDKNNGSWIE